MQKKNAKKKCKKIFFLKINICIFLFREMTLQSVSTLLLLQISTEAVCLLLRKFRNFWKVLEQFEKLAGKFEFKSGFEFELSSNSS